MSEGIFGYFSDILSEASVRAEPLNGYIIESVGIICLVFAQVMENRVTHV